jgi:hypothetical protein
LRWEINEKGTDRDKHILALLYNRPPHLSLLSQQQQIHRWRSQVGRLSNQEIAECANKPKKNLKLSSGAKFLCSLFTLQQVMENLFLQST